MKNEFLIRRLERTLQETPGNFQACYELGRLYCDDHEYTHALRLLERATSLNPLHQPSRFEMGVVYTLMRQHETAVREWQKMLDEDGDLVLEHPGIARASLMLEVQASWERYRDETPPSIFVSYNVGFAYLMLGRTDEAALEFERVIEMNPRFETAHYFLGLIAEKRSQHARAIDLFTRELEIRPQSAHVHHAMADVLLKMHNTGHAITHLQRALQLRPRYAKALYRLGVAFASQSLYDQAEAHLKTAVDLRPCFADAHFHLGQVYERQFREDSMALAIVEYQRAIEAAPRHKEAHFCLGLLYKNLGKSKLDQALAELTRVVELDPLDGEAYYYTGIIHFQKGQYEEAARHHEKALQVAPRHAFARYALGQAHMKMGRHDDAIAALRMVLEAEPGNTQARNAMGAALLARGDLAAAVEQFRRVLDANPHDAQARFSLGAALFRTGRIDEAIEEYQHVTTTQPSSPYAHFNLGASYARSGEYGRAVEEYMQAASMVPSNDTDLALNATLQLLAAIGVEHAQQALELKTTLRQLEEVYIETIKALTNAVDARDANTRHHSSRVAQYARAFAQHLGFPPPQVRRIEIGGYMHDVGKIAIPDYVLQKVGRLTQVEREIIETHPLRGVEIIANLALPWNILPMVRHHHERWDGSGYPDGLKGDEIPVEAQIVAIVDFYDALTSARPYKPALSAALCIEELLRLQGRHFNPVLVEHFVPFVDELILMPPPDQAGV